MKFTTILKSIVKKFIKLSRPNFSFDDNILKFKINSEFFYTFSLDSYETKTRHDPYILSAYTIKSKDLFIEYVRTHHDVEWRGLPSSLFIELVKEKLQIKTMQVLEKYEFKHYDFITYKIDNHFILNFIYISEINKDVFILDINSNLYTNLLKNFKKDYEYNFKKNETNTFDLNLSIVRENALNNYFSHSE